VDELSWIYSMNTALAADPFIEIVRSPAYLFVGAQQAVMQHVVGVLQKQCCLYGGCGVCRMCVAVIERQHHALTWVEPQKSYTLDQIDSICKTGAFALEDGTHHYFILSDADLLTPACANRLLKILEEPPQGYHFILLASGRDAVLPTIRSRCIVHYVQGASTYQQFDDLFNYFIAVQAGSSVEFLKVLDQSKIGEQETVQLLDRLLMYWLDRAKSALSGAKSKEYEKAQQVVGVLKNAYKYLPMPGSSKLFWKDLFLQFMIS
jgi:hypothetical protein